MPIPQVTQINVLDLRKNIAIGVSLPFDGPAGPFNSTYSTKDQIKSNLINLLLTNKGERIMNPQFGCDLKKSLFENITENTTFLIENLIRTNVAFFIPEININSIEIGEATDINNPNAIAVNIKYTIKLPGTPDQITVQFI